MVFVCSKRRVIENLCLNNFSKDKMAAIDEKHFFSRLNDDKMAAIDEKNKILGIEKHFQAIISDKGSISSNPSTVSFEDLPDWYDGKLFKEAQEYYQRNILSVGLASLFGLLTVLNIPSTLKILISTERSNCPCTSFQRYLQTLLHIHTLYSAKIDDPKSRWWQSLNTIRWKHSTNSQKSDSNNLGKISLRDMVLTQFAFIGYILATPEKIGITNEPSGRRGINHFWRVVGHLLEIPDRLNLCRENEAETTELCEKLLKEVVTNLLNNPPEGSLPMIMSMLEGFVCINPTINPEAFLDAWYKLHGLKSNRLTIIGNLFSIYGNGVIFLFGVPYLGSIVRKLINTSLIINYWMLERWQPLAWIKFGAKSPGINLYPIKF